jgi:hypothetical protein
MSLLDVVCCTVVLGPVVGFIGMSGTPEESELVLGFPAMEPMESHLISMALVRFG